MPHGRPAGIALGHQGSVPHRPAGIVPQHQSLRQLQQVLDGAAVGVGQS